MLSKLCYLLMALLPEHFYPQLLPLPYPLHAKKTSLQKPAIEPPSLPHLPYAKKTPSQKSVSVIQPPFPPLSPPYSPLERSRRKPPLHRSPHPVTLHPPRSCLLLYCNHSPYHPRLQRHTRSFPLVQVRRLPLLPTAQTP